MENYITTKECELYRNEIKAVQERKFDELVLTRIDAAATREKVESIAFMLKWWLGILSGLIVGGGMWLLTK